MADPCDRSPSRSRSRSRSRFPEAERAASTAEQATQQLVQEVMCEAMGRAQGAAAASAATAAAATGRTENHWARAARVQVERQRAEAAKTGCKGLSRQEARVSIITSAQEMYKQGQKMLDVAAHEHAAGLSMMAAAESLASTIPAPKMPPVSTALVPAAP